MVRSYIVDVDSTSGIDNKIESKVESVMETSHISNSLLISGVQQYMLKGDPLLIVDESQVVSELSNLVQDEDRVGKSISNSYSLQPCDFSLLITLFHFDLGANSGRILSCIALAKDKEGLVSGDAKLVEAAIATEVQFLKSIPEIVGNFGHVAAVGSRLEIGIGVTETCAHWLVDEQNVVALDPSMLVSLDFVGSHGCWLDQLRAQFHKITQLAGRSWPSVEPDDGGVILDLFLGSSFPTVEHEGQSRSGFVDTEVSTIDHS